MDLFLFLLVAKGISGLVKRISDLSFFSGFNVGSSRLEIFYLYRDTYLSPLSEGQLSRETLRIAFIWDNWISPKMVAFFYKYYEIRSHLKRIYSSRRSLLFNWLNFPHIYLLLVIQPLVFDITFLSGWGCSQLFLRILICFEFFLSLEGNFKLRRGFIMIWHVIAWSNWSMYNDKLFFTVSTIVKEVESIFWFGNGFLTRHH